MGNGQVIETDEVYVGNESGASNLPLNIHSNALAASITVKSGQGILYGFTVLNTNSSAQYVQVFDARTLPAEGIVPVVVFKVNGADDKGVQWLPGRTFRQGIVLCNSSTPDTKTIGAADCFFDVQFV